MTKPVIDHQGGFVTEPKSGGVYYALQFDEVFKFPWSNTNVYYACTNLYATREAAEMALIRVKTLQRLKAMAYGDGWLPEKVYHCIYRPYAKIETEKVYIDVFFENELLASKATDYLTPEEKEAFLYVYKGEDHD